MQIYINLSRMNNKFKKGYNYFTFVLPRCFVLDYKWPCISEYILNIVPSQIVTSFRNLYLNFYIIIRLLVIGKMPRIFPKI